MDRLHRSKLKKRMSERHNEVVLNRKLMILATLYHFVTISVAAEYLFSKSYYHKDNKLWQAMSVPYLMQKYNSAHFKGYFRFPKKSIRTLLDVLRIPEFVPNLAYAIPGDVGFCILLMR